MTIKGLHEFIRKKEKETGNQCIRDMDVKDLSGIKIAVDASLVFQKFYYVAAKDTIENANILKGKISRKAVRVKFFELILVNVRSMLYNKIVPIYVFDGTAPAEKKDTQQERRESQRKNKEKLEVLLETYIRQNEEDYSFEEGEKQVSRDELNKAMSNTYVISYKDKDEAKELFKNIGIPVITAVEEAEKLCAQLCIEGYCHGSLSSDSDILACGSPMMIKDIKFGKIMKAEVIFLEELLNILELTYDQFLDFCIMCGTDFNERYKGCGPVWIYNNILKHGSYYNIVKNYPDKDFSCINYERVKDLIVSKDTNIITFSYSIGGINNMINKIKPYFDYNDKFLYGEVLNGLDKLLNHKDIKDIMLDNND